MRRILIMLLLLVTLGGAAYALAYHRSEVAHVLEYFVSDSPKKVSQRSKPVLQPLKPASQPTGKLTQDEKINVQATCRDALIEWQKDKQQAIDYERYLTSQAKELASLFTKYNHHHSKSELRGVASVLMWRPVKGDDDQLTKSMVTQWDQLIWQLKWLSAHFQHHAFLQTKAELLNISKQLKENDLIAAVQSLEPLDGAAGERHYLSCMIHQGDENV